MSVNKVILVGNLGKDPEIRHTPSGDAVASFSLATTERYKDKQGQKQTKTEWHNIVVWRQLAEVCGKYLRKGSKIYVEGKISNRSYDDRDGLKKYISEVVVKEMTMLDKKPEGQQGGYQQQNNPSYQQQTQPGPREAQYQQQQQGGYQEPTFSPDNGEIPF